jgi:hypothetical protein
MEQPAAAHRARLACKTERMSAPMSPFGFAAGAASGCWLSFAAITSFSAFWYWSSYFAGFQSEASAPMSCFAAGFRAQLCGAGHPLAGTRLKLDPSAPPLKKVLKEMREELRERP